MIDEFPRRIENRGQRGEQDRGDPMPAAGHPLGGECVDPDIAVRPQDGHLAEALGDQTAYGVDTLVVLE